MAENASVETVAATTASHPPMELGQKQNHEDVGFLSRDSSNLGIQIYIATHTAKTVTILKSVSNYSLRQRRVDEYYT